MHGVTAHPPTSKMPIVTTFDLPLPLHVVFERGMTWSFDALPDRAIALDGAVQGPRIDAERARFSFDHHAGCIRHATLSTCEMTFDAIRVGLDPAGFTIYLNDLDADTVLATWLLHRPDVVASSRVERAVRAVGRIDALGPATRGRFPGAIAEALSPIGPLVDQRTLSEPELVDRLRACLLGLDAWFDAGCPARRPPPRVGQPIDVLHDGGNWALVRGHGVRAFTDVYRRGYRAAIVARALPSGTWEYTVGKASEFVPNFPVPLLLEALRTAEREANRNQSPNTSWGGGSTIGGSPRNTDGSSSVLSPERVLAVAQSVLRAA